MVDPVAFQACFSHWLDGFVVEQEQPDGLRVVAIDGKKLRPPTDQGGSRPKAVAKHSFDTAKALRPLHLVSEWVAERHTSLGQVATEEKSNEITAIPELLKQIDISEATVTIDAMGCQRAIAAKIKDKNGEFVIGLKGNQPTLMTTIESFFDDHWEAGDWSKGRCKRFHTSEQKGTQQEDRYYDVATISKRAAVFKNWPSVTAIGMAISVREQDDEMTEKVRDYSARG